MCNKSLCIKELANPMATLRPPFPNLNIPSLDAEDLSSIACAHLRSIKSCFKFVIVDNHSSSLGMPPSLSIPRLKEHDSSPSRKGTIRI